jgi:hypothetical protein
MDQFPTKPLSIPLGLFINFFPKIRRDIRTQGAPLVANGKNLQSEKI